MAVLGMDKLQAVNIMLRANGEKPVPALETGQGTGADDAEKVLDDVDRRYGRGADVRHARP